MDVTQRLPDELLMSIFSLTYKPIDEFRDGDLNDVEPLTHCLVSRHWRRIALACWSTRSFSVDRMTSNPGQFLSLPQHPSLDVLVSTGDDYLGTLGQSVREEIVLQAVRSLVDDVRSLHLHVDGRSLETFQPFLATGALFPQLRSLMIRIPPNWGIARAPLPVQAAIDKHGETLFVGGAPPELRALSVCGIQPVHLLHCGSLTSLKLKDIQGVSIGALVDILRANPDLCEVAFSGLTGPATANYASFTALAHSSVPMRRLRRLELSEVELDLEHLLSPLDTTSAVDVAYNARHHETDTILRRRRGLDAVILDQRPLAHLRAFSGTDTRAFTLILGGKYTEMVCAKSDGTSSAVPELEAVPHLHIKFRSLWSMKKPVFNAIGRAIELPFLTSLRVVVADLGSTPVGQEEWRALFASLQGLQHLSLELDDAWDAFSALRNRLSKQSDASLLCPVLQTLTLFANARSYRTYPQFGQLVEWLRYRRMQGAPLQLVRIAAFAHIYTPRYPSGSSRLETSVLWFEREMENHKLGRKRADDDWRPPKDSQTNPVVHFAWDLEETEQPESPSPPPSEEEGSDPCMYSDSESSTSVCSFSSSTSDGKGKERDKGKGKENKKKDTTATSPGVKLKHPPPRTPRRRSSSVSLPPDSPPTPPRRTSEIRFFFTFAAECPRKKGTQDEGKEEGEVKELRPRPIRTPAARLRRRRPMNGSSMS